MKNRSRLPRTAGLRTLSDLTTDLTKAGLDPSRVQERAIALAKLRGAQKRKRDDEDEAGMDVDMDEAAAEGEWMDVDGEDGTPNKRVKSNSGAVVPKNRREPRTNRQLAGMRNEEVRGRRRCRHRVYVPVSVSALTLILVSFPPPRIAIRKSDQTAQPRPAAAQHARQGGRGRPRDPNENGACYRSLDLCQHRFADSLVFSPNISSRASGRRARPTADDLPSATTYLSTRRYHLILPLFFLFHDTVCTLLSHSLHVSLHDL